MASPGGDGDSGSSPASVPYEVLGDLLEVRKSAVKLQSMLAETPSSSCAAASTRQLSQLLDGVVSRLQASTLSVMSPAGGGAGRRGSGGRKKKSPAAEYSGPHRRSSSGRRRSKSPFVKMVTAKELEDGKQWRKYGQKHIQDSPNPRSYYRCTHKPDQGCMATKQVQASETNPSEFVISYYGEHTCRDPSTIPFVFEAEAPTADYANLISFGSRAAAVASTSRDVPLQSHRHFLADAAAAAAVDPTPACSFANCGSPVSPPECASEEVMQLSSSLPLAAVVGSAGTTPSTSIVGSAPAGYWPSGVIGGDMAGSFPSSPSSLGFNMAGSLGSFGNLPGDDDDMFGFDP
ncbi:probable WRKY transcription factor 54 [Oryza brachyantha]|uniref:probable WRKY transcription factor 54 n=1 Tax=Oryza brachyantha TaxID=4533 RepID=UPI001ADA911E|nr:probable WRKY transcription factor 54 [Oryza brachyantha]